MYSCSKEEKNVIMDDELSHYVEKFIKVYLPKYKGCSINTIRSYEFALRQYIIWVSDSGESISDEPYQVKVLDFSKEQILEWLCHIEEKGCCAATRNQRLAAIRSFFAFVTEENLIYTQNFFSISRIRQKKTPRPVKDFLNIEELTMIMNSIGDCGDTSLKHYMLLCVLYESGARMEELINMKVEDVTLGNISYIRIFGKGQKYRNVYISGNVALLIKEYCKHFGITRGYLFTSHLGTKLTDTGVNYIIKQYVNKAAQKMPSLWGKRVTAHTFRRSKATHMLQNGLSIIVIQHFLGHESLKTTEKYIDVGIQDMVIAANRCQSPLYTTYQFMRWDKIGMDNQKTLEADLLYS